MRWLAKPALIVVTILAWLPMLAVLLTVAVTFATGCQVDEGNSHPCIVMGHDIGDTLYAGLIMVFLAGPALPFGIGLVIFWILLWRRAKARHLAQPHG